MPAENAAALQTLCDLLAQIDAHPPATAAALLDQMAHHALLAAAHAWLRAGQPPAALDRLDSARTLAPETAELEVLRARVLRLAGRAGEALAATERALAMKPGPAALEVDARAERGLALVALGRLSEAETDLKRALTVRTQDGDMRRALAALQIATARPAMALETLGVPALAGDGEARRLTASALRDLGKLDAALAVTGDALATLPDPSPDLRYEHAQLLRRNGQFEAAEHAARALAADAPTYAPVLNELILLAQRAGRFDEAIRAARQAVALMPERPEPRANLGSLLLEQGDPAAALAQFEQVNALAPTLAQPWLARGNALMALDRPAEAAACFAAAALRDPRMQAAREQEIIARHDAGDLGAAVRLSEALVRDVPGDPRARMNLAVLRLAEGRWAEAWALYESRMLIPEFAPFRGPNPVWGGESLDGRRLLLVHEQGLGDSLMCLRFLSLLRARGARLLLAVQTPLQSLVSTLPGVEAVLVAGAPVPAHDLTCPMMSLPGRFASTPTQIAGDVPYLRADPARVARWVSRIAPQGVKVGLVWAGGPDHRRDRQRSIRLSALAPLFAVPGIAWHGVQVGAAARAQMTPAVLPPDFRDLGAEIDDFVDTAAILAQLDLLIAVDTSVAHLAGAMGRPAWVMLHAQPDWRWGHSGVDTPWYPSLRLFRQAQPGDWGPVVADLVAALARIASDRDQAKT